MEVYEGMKNSAYSYGNRPKFSQLMNPKRAIISDNAIVDFYNLIFDNHFDQSLVIVGVPAKSITKIIGGRNCLFLFSILVIPHIDRYFIFLSDSV